MVLLIPNTFLYGQDSLRNKEKMLLVKTSPFLLIGGDFITNSMSIPLGMELEFHKNFSFNQSFSYIFLSGDNGGYLMLKVKRIKGIRTDSEIKRYLNKRNNFTGSYVATHFLYQYTESIGYYPTGNGNGIVYRNLVALHEKIGWQSISKKGFVFDIAVGFGLRYTNSESSDNSYYPGAELTPLYWYKKDYDNGSKLFFSVNGTFTVGWRINFSKTNKI